VPSKSRQYANQYTFPIYRLPLELIQRTAFFPASNSLIATTYVCPYSRVVLLPVPTLWSHIDFGQPRNSQAFLERAGGGPIHVSLGLHPDELVFASLYDKVPRLVLVKYSIHTLNLDLVAYPMLSLKELRVTGRGCLAATRKITKLERQLEI